MQPTSRLREFVIRVDFKPGLLGVFLNPFYRARRGLYRNIIALASHVHGRVLDVGCGWKPYQNAFAAASYVGLEIDTPGNRAIKRADCYYDGNAFPFEDCGFDAVIINQVLEHVFNPDEFLMEVQRVLKPGGALLLTVPFVWDEHEQPYDYGRYSSFGLSHLLLKHGLRVVVQRKSVDGLQAICQLFIGYLYKSLYTRNPWINRLLVLLTMSPVNIVGLLCGLLPSFPDFYLDNVVLARKEPSTKTL